MFTLGIAYAMGNQGAAAHGGSSGSVFSMIMMWLVIFVIFYFLLMRPQQKKAQDQRKFLDNLKKGDEVVTASGIYGTITGLTDAVVTLEIEKDVRIKITRSATAQYAREQIEKDKVHSDKDKDKDKAK